MLPNERILAKQLYTIPKSVFPHSVMTSGSPLLFTPLTNSGKHDVMISWNRLSVLKTDSPAHVSNSMWLSGNELSNSVKSILNITLSIAVLMGLISSWSMILICSTSENIHFLRTLSHCTISATLLSKSSCNESCKSLTFSSQVCSVVCRDLAGSWVSDPPSSIVVLLCTGISSVWVCCNCCKFHVHFPQGEKV